MASTDDQAVNFTLSATDETGAAIASVKKNMASMGGVVEEQGGKSSSALKGVGFAAKGLAAEMGISGGMARMFGNEAKDMAKELGTAGIAFGLVGIAAIAAYKIYDHMKDSVKEHREELQKTTGQMLEHTKSLYENKLETEGVTKARRELAKAEREIYLQKSVDMIRAEKDELEELNKKLLEGGTLWERIKRQITTTGEDGAERQEKLNDKTKKYTDSLKLEIAAMEKKVKVHEEERKAATNPITPTTIYYDSAEITRYKYLASGVEQQKALDAEASYQTARANLYKAYGASDAELYQADLDAFDAATNAKLNTLKYADDQKEYMAQRSMERMAREAAYQRKADEDVQKNKITMLNGTSMVLGQLYELSGKKMKAFYYLQQTAAAGEAFIQYKVAAAKAVGQTGIFGIDMEAYFTAMSYIVPSLIMAKAFGVGGGGDSGGGESGAMPTYSANSNTGLPESKSGDSFNLKLVINGQERTIADITSGVMRTLYNGNGSVDGFQVLVERSA